MRSEETTTFENNYTPNGRVQYLHKLAPALDFSMVPEQWRSTPIIHLGPVAREVDPTLARAFTNSFVGLTPRAGCVPGTARDASPSPSGLKPSFVLQHANAAVISIEDVRGNESIVEEMASSIRVLAVTEGANGARLYWNGDLRRFRPPQMQEIDPTGAGDIFASAFFIRLQATRDPWEAARFATNLAAYLGDALRAGWRTAPRRSPGGNNRSASKAGAEKQKRPRKTIQQKAEGMARIYTIVNQKGGVGRQPRPLTWALTWAIMASVSCWWILTLRPMLLHPWGLIKTPCAAESTKC